MRIGVSPVIGLIVLWTFCNAALAQQVESSGAIRGVVSDPGGGVIVGASVVAENQNTGVKTPTVTNESGSYLLANVRIGVYSLEISFRGFQTFRKTDLRVVSGATLTQDITLPIGETTQVVSVVAQAELVDSSSTTTGNTRVSEEIKDLPLPLPASWRTPAAICLLFPGLTPTFAPELKSNESAVGPTWASVEATVLPAVLQATPLMAFLPPPT